MSADISASNELLATILATAPMNILVIEAESLRVLLVNERYRQTLDPEWRARDLIGRPATDFLPDLETSGIAASLREVGRTGKAVHLSEWRFRGFARGDTYWDCDITPMCDTRGVCTALMLAAVEVTEHIAARRELATLGEISAAVMASLDLNEVMDRVLAAIASLIPFDRGFVLLDDGGDDLCIVAARDDVGKSAFLAGTRVPKDDTSINGWVYDHGEPLNIPDVYALRDVPYAPYHPDGHDPAFRALLCVPLVAQGRVIGTIHLTRYATDAFTDADLGRLLRIAPQAAVALANARLYGEATERATQLETLNDVTMAVAGSLSLSEVLDRALAEIERVVSYDRAFVALPDTDGQHLETVSLRGVAESLLHSRTPIDRSIAGAVYAGGEPVRVPNLATDPVWRAQIYDPHGDWQGQDRSLLIAPLRARGATVGVLYLTRDRDGAYTADDLARLLRFTAVMGVAITNAQLYARSVAQVVELRHVNDDMETLHEIGIITTSTLDLTAVLSRVLAQISRVVPYEQGLITLDTPARDCLRVEVALGPSVTPLIGTELSLDHGINSWVYNHGATARIGNLPADDWTQRVYVPSLENITSVLCTPLKIGGQSIGTLHLMHSAADIYRMADVARIEQHARQVAVAVQNARLFTQVQQQVAELQTLNSDLATLNEIGLAISGSLDLGTVLPRVLHEILQIIPAEYGYVTLIEPDRHALRIVSDHGFPESQVGTRVPIAGSVNGAIIQTGQTVRIGDVFTDPDWSGRWYPAPSADAPRMHNILGTAMIAAGEPIGTIYLVHSRADVFTAEDEGRLRRYAAQVAVAVENARLYERIQTQLDDVRRLNHELAEVSRHKSEFLATMSHELRTPLNAIIGFTQLLYDGIVTEPEERQMCLADVDASAHHLLRLINDVLDVAKIEAGQMELHRERFDVRDEIAEAERLMAPLVQQRRQTLRVTRAADVPPVFADRARFRQIILNVLSNANKFTPDGGAITVVTDTVDTQVRVRVTDTGIGIRPEDAPKVFEEFRQIDGSLSRRYTGTGLGLALSRRLVEMLGGGIRFESEPGIGTTFFIALPAAKTSPPASRP